MVCCIGTVGKIGVAGTRLATNQQINSVVFDRPKMLSAKYGVYALMSSEQEHIRCANKVVVAILNKSGQGNIPLSAPPIPEQCRIAAYLDEQTGKIDRLMEMRRRQMALLKEQRAALIQQAVTRGLNPNVPMKDSGLPWLGEIPAHWAVMPVKYAARISRGRFGHRPRTDPVLYDGPYPFVQTGDVATAKKFLTSYTQTLTEKGYSVSVEFPAGTLLMAIAANIGDLAILGINACLPDSIVGFFPYTGIDVEFLYYQLSCMQSRLHALAPENTQMNLNIDRLSPEKIVVPPHEEQKEICRRINESEAKIESTQSAYARQLTLLAEYRAALIHECVTGQRTVTQRTAVETRPTKANVHFLRAVLCSEIVHRLHQEPTFGRVKLEKILFLSEAYAGIDLEGRYQRAAAGPFDNRALRSAESQIQKQKWYRPVKGEKGTRYVPMEKAGGHQKYFPRYWPEQQPKFDRLVELLRSFDTEQCEIVATLFAVWKDGLRADQPCTDADIVEEVLTQWHPSKQRIPRERWLNALQWMKQEGLTP